MPIESADMSAPDHAAFHQSDRSPKCPESGGVVPFQIGDWTGSQDNEALAQASARVPGVNVLGLRRNERYSSVSAATLIVTETGIRPAGELQAGDLVQTLDNGFQPLLWADSSSAEPWADDTAQDHRAIRIAAGAFGAKLPVRPIVVAPDQGVLVDCARCEANLGERQNLVAARDLLHLDGVERSTVAGQRMVHLMLAAHELLDVGGIWVDSFRPDTAHLNTLSDAQVRALKASCPRLSYASSLSAYVACRPTLNATEALTLFRPDQDNAVALSA